LDPTLKRLTPTYAVLFMRNTAWAITLSGPVMPLYVRSLGVDIVFWGVLATAISAGLFMEVVWGTILDRVNRRLLILSALVGTSLIYPLYTIKALLPLFIVLQFIFGAVNVMIGLTTRAVIADDLPTGSSGFST
jgi:sugar phosphate permease